MAKRVVVLQDRKAPT